MPKNKQLTLSDIIRIETKKCMEDPVYFMRKYVKIQHPHRGTVAFDLFPFQEDLLRSFKGNRLNIILKARQLGITTLISAFSLWTMIFHKDKNILVISIKQEVSKEIITKVRFANNNLPSWLKVRADEDNRLSLKFANGSHIRATSSSGDAGRSLALSLLIIDEAAFIDEAEEIWTSAWNTLSTGGNSIVLSTPNGMGNWFHSMWQKAETGESEFNPIRLHWSLHPERDQRWRDEQTKELGPRKAAQECDCDFLTSGNNVVDLMILKWYKESMVKDPIETRGDARNLWIWERPNYSKGYVVCADVARGDGEDFSAAHVLDLETLNQVAEYKGQIGTRDFGRLLIALATEYNTASLIIEREGCGWDTIQECIDCRYRNLFYTSTDASYVDVERQLSNRLYAQDKKMVPGFGTNYKTRQLIINAVERYFRERLINIYSKRTIAELETFVWDKGKAQAAKGFNDDLIMALGIGLWVRDTAFKLQQEGQDLMRTIMGNISKTEVEDVPVYTTRHMNNAEAQWRMGVGSKGATEDLRWLIR